MIDEELAKLKPTALRDYADDPRIARVWLRLDKEVVPARSRARARFLLVPALAAALFLGGFILGRRSAPVHEPLVASAEAAPAPDPLPGPAAATLPPYEPKETASKARAERPRPSALRAPAIERLAGPEARNAGAELAAPYTALPSEPPEWQQKAEQGDFAAARAALLHAGGWDVALSSASPEQLMSLVDLARASGEREQAVRALRRLLNSFPGAPEAPLAAWTLGNLLEQGGERSGAAEAFALYRRLSPAGDFAEDAAARQIDAALSQGDQERAAELIDQYEKDFPNGRRLAELREELAKLRAEPSSEQAAPPAPSAASTAEAAVPGSPDAAAPVPAPAPSPAE